MASVDQSSLLNGDDFEQRTYVRWYRIKDALGVPLCVVWYFAQAAMLQQDHGSFVGGNNAPNVGVLAVQVFGAVAALYVFGEQLAIPPPVKGEDFYDLMRCVGRWIFLTRHCMVLQATHMVLSCVALALDSKPLGRLTYGMTFWIGSLGAFVTVQFFVLVFNHPEFKARCEEMAAKGINLRMKAAVMHAPGIVVALLDVEVGKSHAHLKDDCSLLASIGMVFGYVVFYTLLIVLNFRATGQWPYGVLKQLKSLAKWCSFIVGQTAIISIFCVGLWGLSQLPAVW